MRHYKGLSRVEAAFRSLKIDDLQIRPIHHHSEPRVRTHLFLCMLAYYVKWHMNEAWRGLLFDDGDQQRPAQRDPVAPATRPAAALEKVATKTLRDGSPAHSFRTLLNDLDTIVRNTCRRRDAAPDESTFEIDTNPQCQAATGTRSDRRHPVVARRQHQQFLNIFIKTIGYFAVERGTSG